MKKIISGLTAVLTTLLVVLCLVSCKKVSPYVGTWKDESEVFNVVLNEDGTGSIKMEALMISRTFDITYTTSDDGISILPTDSSEDDEPLTGYLDADEDILYLYLLGSAMPATSLYREGKVYDDSTDEPADTYGGSESILTGAYSNGEGYILTFDGNGNLLFNTLDSSGVGTYLTDGETIRVTLIIDGPSEETVNGTLSKDDSGTITIQISIWGETGTYTK